MNTLKNDGLQFLDFLHIQEAEISKYRPLAGSFAVINSKGKFLLCYNIWRKQWELPAGRREGNETPRECAMRELYEETFKAEFLRFLRYYSGSLNFEKYLDIKLKNPGY
ncbi:8-oxo-dGTP diphosphatase [Peribacillus deserti]|uniref:8-oxo-dGTP diphosphatase n=1 Tax=Peribacillus deserti TaxID=673318 RepID=A0ABS2QE40_9BACI|nr:NUDIX hydrolase [Peribacillus deserti]MBM7691428.1 8-oxo-dGTP diphosphatase [Peribacillus deserti]